MGGVAAAGGSVCAVPRMGWPWRALCAVYLGVRRRAAPRRPCRACGLFRALMCPAAGAPGAPATCARQHEPRSSAGAALRGCPSPALRPVLFCSAMLGWYAAPYRRNLTVDPRCETRLGVVCKGAGCQAWKLIFLAASMAMAHRPRAPATPSSCLRRLPS